MNNKSFLAAFILFIFAGTSLSSAQTKPYKELIDSEHAFSKMSEEHGVKDSFTEFLDDTSLVLRPYLTKGKTWYQTHPDPPVALKWYPCYAEVANSGDYGFTTGPWTMSEKGKGPASTDYGYFISVWKKNAAGQWKVIIDLGIDTPQIDEFPQDASTISPPQFTTKDTLSDPGNEMKKITSFEEDLSRLSLKNGNGRILKPYLSASARIYRSIKYPALSELSRDTLLSNTQLTGWRIEKLMIAPSGDLAAVVSSTFTGGYMFHIWHKEQNGVWKIIIDWFAS